MPDIEIKRGYEVVSSNKYSIILLLVAMVLFSGCVGNTPEESNLQTFTNSIDMEFVLIPAGEFDMGSQPIEKRHKYYYDEGPVHHVTIANTFYMGKYEVTQKQWRNVMGSNPSNFKGDNLPVESVSWNDAQEFIKKLNEKEGINKYRLPSEAEWEYASRAGTTTRYSFGDDDAWYGTKLGDYAWYGANSGSKTHEVGQKKPNPWGLYDMHGNVWEWVQDIYKWDYNGAPTDGAAWEEGDSPGRSRVQRGGSWYKSAEILRSASRSASLPGDGDTTTGIRLLRSTSSSTPEVITTVIQTPKVTPTASPAPIIAQAEDQKVFTNSIGMEVVLIPAGEFDMGSPANEKYRDSDEGPVHRVKISKAFYIGKYEVTQKQWREIMGSNPSRFKGDNLPVEEVSWNKIQEFIKKLNEKEGTTRYRLPSEAEWEYAARSGTTTGYSFGDDESMFGDYAWVESNSGSKTHEVGQKKPNLWGVYDMHGNVWEWVQDIYHNSYNGAPTDGNAWEGVGSFRVFRGGSWLRYARYSRSANRGYDFPDKASDFSVGFRLLRST